MNNEALVKIVVKKVLDMMNLKILLLVSGGAVNVSQIFGALSSEKLIKYDIACTEAGKKAVPEKYILDMNCNVLDSGKKLFKAIKEDDLIFIPIMTRNTLVKCALGIEDNLVTTAIAQALMMNKNVVAIKDSFDPKNPINMSLGLTKNSVYNDMILKYEKTLVNMGMKFINSDEIGNVIGKNRSFQNFLEDNLSSDNLLSDNLSSDNILTGVLTKKDIIKSCENGQVFIRKNAIITPLAEEYILNEGIDVRYC
jgi:hypothetical protein